MVVVVVVGGGLERKRETCQMCMEEVSHHVHGDGASVFRGEREQQSRCDPQGGGVELVGGSRPRICSATMRPRFHHFWGGLQCLE